MFFLNYLNRAGFHYNKVLISKLAEKRNFVVSGQKS